jgi:predicted nucleic acid-binding protein
MPILLDTNILLRIAEPTAVSHRECVDAVQRLVISNSEPIVCAQILIEFWVVATRPTLVNGLAMDVAEARSTLDDFGRLSRCLPEPPDMARRWREVVEQHLVLGKEAHDARIVALMLAHGIDQLLTLNTMDFARYPHLKCLTPSAVLRAP